VSGVAALSSRAVPRGPTECNGHGYQSAGALPPPQYLAELPVAKCKQAIRAHYATVARVSRTRASLSDTPALRLFRIGTPRRRPPQGGARRINFAPAARRLRAPHREQRETLTVWTENEGRMNESQQLGTPRENRWKWWTLDLEGRKPARCCVRSRRAECAIPMSSHASGADRKAFSADGPRHEARDRGRHSPGVTSVRKGDHVIPLYTPNVASANPACRERRICVRPSARPRQRRDAGGTSRSRSAARCAPLHGVLHVLQLHGAAGDRGRQIREDAPFDKVLLHRLRASRRASGAVITPPRSSLGRMS